MQEGSGVTVLSRAVEQINTSIPAVEVRSGLLCPTLLAGPMALPWVIGILAVASLSHLSAGESLDGLRRLPEPQPQLA